MNFLADEDVEKPVVEMLRLEGHDVLYMCEIATRTIDEKLLAQANSESRILLTGDKATFVGGLCNCPIALGMELS